MPDVQTVPDATPAVPVELTPEEMLIKRREAMYSRIAELGGPSEQQIGAWKAQAPGGRLRAFSLDNVRFFIVRAIGGLELTQIRKSVNANSSDPEGDIKIEAAVLCTSWTNATVEKRFSSQQLRQGTAGLPQSIWMLIETLSDYADPADFQVCSIDL